MRPKDSKGIFAVLHPLTLTTEMMADPVAAEYVGSHTVDATIRARWQDSLTGPRLLDWSLVELWMDGVSLTETTVPNDFPMPQVLNSVNFSSLTRKRLEAMGPGEES